MSSSVNSKCIARRISLVWANVFVSWGRHDELPQTGLKQWECVLTRFRGQEVCDQSVGRVLLPAKALGGRGRVFSLPFF